jgi:short-subunit dehydrogenase
VLWGRNEERLSATAELCRAKGAATETACFDLTEFDQLVERLAKADALTPFDLAIFNAGLGGSLARNEATQGVAAAQRMASVNFTAPIIGADLLAGLMAKRGHGRIVLIGSVAESFPLPMSPVYAGTKAGLALFAEALDLRLAQYGVRVTLVSPGFVDTPMSRSLDESRPFLIGADEAAAIIARKIERGKRRIVVPWQFAVIQRLANLLPRWILRAVLTRMLRAQASH